jgi:hypothetical protein
LGFFEGHGNKFELRKKGIDGALIARLFAQTMKIYGGHHMRDLFQLNFVGPCFKMTKQVNNKGVRFVLGEHVTIFKCVS